MAKYYLRKYPNCRVLSFDRISEDEALKTVEPHLRHRIHFVSMNVQHLTDYVIDSHIKRNFPDMSLMHV